MYAHNIVFKIVTFNYQLPKLKIKLRLQTVITYHYCCLVTDKFTKTSV